jgi:4'-phosphopantetheinyl transferase
MPLIKLNRINEQSVFGIWKIDESLGDLSIHLTSSELEKIDGFHPTKQKEFIASRLLVKELSTECGLGESEVLKDEYNKPFFAGNSARLSISHCYPYAVAMIHLSEECGIDIEKIDQRVLRVAHKFLAEDETKWANGDVTKTTLLWSAKEALYKTYGRKALSFKEKIHLKVPINLSENNAEGSVLIESEKTSYNLGIVFFKEFIITFSPI